MRATLISILLSAALGAAPAGQDAGATAQWLVNFVSNHMNREFCPPPGTTYGLLAKQVNDYMAAHPAQNKDMTDPQWLTLLETIYPCQHPAAPSATDGSALAVKPLGAASGKYVIGPTGIYSTIDIAQTKALLAELRGPVSASTEQKISVIKTHGGDYTPPVLMQVAISEFSAGKVDDAIFWFHAGLLRTMLDVRLSVDPSVADAPTLMIRQTPLRLVKASISDDARIAEIVQKVIAWDAQTPYGYDHRWIALHGSRATQSSLDPAHAPTTLTAPESQWPTLMMINRGAYANFVSRNAARVKAALN